MKEMEERFFEFCMNEYSELNERIKEKFNMDERHKSFLIVVNSLLNSKACILQALRTTSKKKRKKIFNRFMKDFEKDIFDVLTEEEKDNNPTYDLLEALVRASFQ